MAITFGLIGGLAGGCQEETRQERGQVRLNAETAEVVQAAMAHSQTTSPDGSSPNPSFPFSGVVDDDPDKPVILMTRTYDVRHLVAAVPSFTDVPTYYGRRKPTDQSDESHGGLVGGGGGGGGLFGGGSGGGRGGPGSGPVPRELLVGQLMEMAQDNVAPDAWRSRGGLEGAMSEQDGVLLVTASPQTHVMLEDFFRDLSRARVGQVAIDVTSYAATAPGVDSVVAAAGGPVMGPDQVQGLMGRIAADPAGYRIISRGSAVCFNGQWVSLSDVHLAVEQRAEPVVGTNVMGMDVSYEVGLDGNRPGAVMTLNPTIDPTRGDVILTFGQQLNQPLPGAAERQQGVKGDEVVYRRELAARLVEQRTTARVPDGGAMLLTSYSAAGDGVDEQGGVITVIRVRAFETQ